MPDIRRFVTYLYYYENNHKMQIAGFAKIEIRGDECKLELHINAPGFQGKVIPVYLFARKEENMHAVEIGTMVMNQKGGEYRTILHGNKIGHSMYGIRDMKGLLMLVDERSMYASQWDEGGIDRGKLMIYEEKMLDNEALQEKPQEQLHEQEQSVPEPASEQQPESEPQPASTPELTATEVPMRKILTSAIPLEQNTEQSLWSY